MEPTLIWGTVIMVVLGIVFGFMAGRSWPKGAEAAARASAPKRKTAAKRAPAKRKTSGGRGKAKSKSRSRK